MTRVARASSRFATFAHAMSRTKPTAPTRTRSAVLMRRVDISFIELATMVH